MPKLHLTKVAFACRDVEALRARVAARSEGGEIRVPTRMRPRRQAGIHIVLLGLAALWLPIGLTAAVPPATVEPALWVPWFLLSSIGPVFFIVSAQAPLMQRWYALETSRGDPYLLYAASNLGSFAGLISYPLVVEPLMSLNQQSWLWTGIYAFLVLFAATGMGDGSTYRMIPSIFAARGLATGAVPGTAAGVRVQRKAAAAEEKRKAEEARVAAKKAEEDRKKAEKLEKERAKRQAEADKKAAEEAEKEARKQLEEERKKAAEKDKRNKEIAEAAERLAEAQKAYEAELAKTNKGGVK